MSPASFFLFCFLSQLPLLTSTAAEENSTCQPFDCGKLGKIKFPFTKTKSPKCGLCFIDGCDEDNQKMKLGKEEKENWYEVKSISQANNIVIIDQEFQKLLNLRKCEIFKNLTLLHTPFIDIQITHNQTFFKCNSSGCLNTTVPDYFNYTGCGNTSLYFSHTNHTSPQKFLPQCSIIQLPLGKNWNSNDPFALVTDEISLDLKVWPDCHGCVLRGGKCEIGSRGEFHCAYHVKKGTIGKSVRTIIAAGVGVFVVVVCLYILSWKKKTRNHGSIEAFIRNYGTLAPKRFSHSDIKKITNSFKDKLGQGGYGSVYKGKLLDRQVVAVKMLSKIKGDGEEFINEIESISRTSHVNIVSLLGFCFEGNKRAIIYEYMPNGSLEKYIFNKNPGTNVDYPPLGCQTLFQISLGIARGLEYLHRGCNTRILHFDIKPHNILLDENFIPKISDFGLAKICSRNESIISMLGPTGTAGYIAPEVFCRNFGAVSHKSDVYSYGMMVLEMVGGRKNIDAGVENTSEIYFPHWVYKRLELDEELGLQGTVNEEDKENAKKMIIVSLWCIQADPSIRPPMSRVLEMLIGSLESLKIPPPPFLSSPSRAQADSSTTILL